VARQTTHANVVGSLRVAVALLPPLARTLDLSPEDRRRRVEVGEESKSAKARGKRGPAPKIQQQFEQVALLPKAEQRVIAQALDSMLAQARRCENDDARARRASGRLTLSRVFVRILRHRPSITSITSLGIRNAGFGPITSEPCHGSYLARKIVH
jgi:hypothetical protein